MEEDWPTLVPQTGYKYAGTRLQSSLPCDQPLLPLFHMRNAPRPRDEARKSTHASGSGSFARPPPPVASVLVVCTAPYRTALQPCSGEQSRDCAGVRASRSLVRRTCAVFLLRVSSASIEPSSVLFEYSTATLQRDQNPTAISTSPSEIVHPTRISHRVAR